MRDLKDLRNEKKLTQQQVADLLGISLRSYKSYENDEKKFGTLKYNYIAEKLAEINPIDEEHGIIEIGDIKQKCSLIFERYEVSFCYLFGSYAKGKAHPASDVDLLISANVKGLKFYGLVEEIRTALHKKVDVLDINQLKDNLELTKEILKDGIKIYG
ncbi:MAG: nucleotidyltransferase domain-containing protein [Lachnospiraceae bacterium]|nr:nucleotidyltransferase domain-containing protein [Lachnospiraceae bacterium]MDD7176564.1 nucleotidyltransferase domain-containing protein [bacterium]MDY5518030.1 nucleotidyltransferase domain-containing protein [Lachnospiraceae bacterium]